MVTVFKITQQKQIGFIKIHDFSKQYDLSKLYRSCTIGMMHMLLPIKSQPPTARDLSIEQAVLLHQSGIVLI